MKNKLAAFLVSAAVFLISLGVDLLRGGDHPQGSALVALGVVCVALAIVWRLPKGGRR